MSYRDDYQALEEQLRAARRQASEQRRELGEELASERRKVEALERELEALKRARSATAKGQGQTRRTGLLVGGIALAFLVAGGVTATMLLLQPSPPSRPVKAVSSSPRPPRPPARAARPPKPAAAVPKPGTTPYMLHLVERERSPSKKALASVSAAATLAGAEGGERARQLLASAADLAVPRRNSSTALRAIGLAECLAQRVTGAAPGPDGRFPRLTALLERQLSHKHSADAWTWVGRACRDLRGMDSTDAVLARAEAPALSVRRFQRLRTLMAVVDAHADQGNKAGVDRLAGLILGSKAGLIASDQVKARALLAETYWRLGERERAATLLKDASRRISGRYFTAEAEALVARAKALTGDAAGARTWLGQAIAAVKAESDWGRRRTLPHLAATLHLLGDAAGAKDLHADQGQTAAALFRVGKLAQAAAMSGLPAQARYRLALALARTGDREGAIAVIRAMGSDPLHAPAMAGVMLNTPAEVK